MPLKASRMKPVARSRVGVGLRVGSKVSFNSVRFRGFKDSLFLSGDMCTFGVHQLFWCLHSAPLGTSMPSGVFYWY